MQPPPPPRRFKDDGESSDEDVGKASASCGDREDGAPEPSFLHVCRSPPSDHGRDLPSTSSRVQKRLEKRSAQREAALALHDLVSPTTLLFPSPAGRSAVQVASTAPTPRRLRLPVLEPSTFCLDEELQNTAWVLVQRRKKTDAHLRGRRRRQQRKSPLKLKVRFTAFSGIVDSDSNQRDQRISTLGRTSMGSLTRHESPPMYPRGQEGQEGRASVAQLATTRTPYAIGST
jgi:hypothetical protein